MDNSGLLSGTPTRAGFYVFSVQAHNFLGSDQAKTGFTVVDPTTTAAPTPRPETGRQRVRAKICTTPAGHAPACATRTLYGTIPRLEDRAAARLVRGPVTYATGHTTAAYRLSAVRSSPGRSSFVAS